MGQDLFVDAHDALPAIVVLNVTLPVDPHLVACSWMFHQVIEFFQDIFSHEPLDERHPEAAGDAKSQPGPRRGARAARDGRGVPGGGRERPLRQHVAEPVGREAWIALLHPRSGLADPASVEPFVDPDGRSADERDAERRVEAHLGRLRPQHVRAGEERVHRREVVVEPLPVQDLHAPPEGAVQVRLVEALLEDLLHTIACKAAIKAGDVVTVRGGSQKNVTIQHAVEEVKGRGVPEWLTLDGDQFTGRVVSLPTREQINLPVQEQLIVELYSK